jgi:hypothetical protein
VTNGPGAAAMRGRHRGTRVAVSLALLLCPSALEAHEVRPALLQLTELAPGHFEVVWKQPIAPGDEPGLALRLPLEPRFPALCGIADRALPELTASVLVERWVLTCGAGGLSDGEIAIDGLSRTLTDVLVRARFLDGTALDRLLRPDAPRTILSHDRSEGPGVPAHPSLGVDHLIFGFDHILFVVGLMFFVRRPLQLVQVVSAFTIAHSLTLALSTLGVVTLSQRPVEAVIALSILFLAVELARGASGRRSELARWPWSIAFGFGLLHGFGFAGALAEIGLPEEARAAALLLFNVGVEIGQLLVVGVLLALRWALGSGRLPLPAFAAQLPIYVMGVVAAYWFVERVGSMVGG